GRGPGGRAAHDPFLAPSLPAATPLAPSACHSRVVNRDTPDGPPRRGASGGGWIDWRSSGAGADAPGTSVRRNAARSALLIGGGAEGTTGPGDLRKLSGAGFAADAEEACAGALPDTTGGAKRGSVGGPRPAPPTPR